MKLKIFLGLLLSCCITLFALAQTKPTTVPSPPQNPADDDVVKITTNTIARRFSPNENLFFACMIYNATQLGNPMMRAELFHDGKKLYSVPEVRVQTANQTDLNRVFVSGSLRLNADVDPASYYLEILIADKNAKEKTAPLMQWAEFEVVK